MSNLLQHHGQYSSLEGTDDANGNEEPGESSWRRLLRSLHPLAVSRAVRKHWWRGILPFLLAVAWFLWTCWFNALMQVLCQRRENIQEEYWSDPLMRNVYNKPNREPKHPHADRHRTAEQDEPQPQSDLGYHTLPDLHKIWIVCDCMALALLLLLVIKFTCLSSCKARVVLKRYALIQGFLFFFRGSSIYLTAQTIPLTSCEATIEEDTSAFVEAFYVMLGVHRTCADLLFSGHAAFFTMGFLLVRTYGKGEEWMALCGWRDRLKHKRRALEEEREQARLRLAESSFVTPTGGYQQDTESGVSVTVSHVQPSTGDSHSWVASPEPVVSGGAAPPLPLLTNEQVRERAHEELSRAHPWFIPVLNGAGDPSTLTVTSLFFLLYALVGYFFLVSTHFHYSVDVFIGVLVAAFTFGAYHAALKTLHERHRGPLKSFITWFEGIPKVGEFVREEEPREQKKQRKEQQAHFEATPLLAEVVRPAATSAVAMGGDSAPLRLHTYVYYSLTQNRYILKRIPEAADSQRAASTAARAEPVEGEEERKEPPQSDQPHTAQSPAPSSILAAAYSLAAPPTESKADSTSDESRSSGTSNGKSRRQLSRAEELQLVDEQLAREDAEARYAELGVYQSSPLSPRV